jgi:hypothetical protein
MMNMCAKPDGFEDLGNELVRASGAAVRLSALEKLTVENTELHGEKVQNINLQLCGVPLCNSVFSVVSF